MDNVIRVKTDMATNQMDVVDLERILKELTASKTPVAVVVCTMGTTDSSCFDPIGKVRALLDRYPNPAGFGKTVLYADAVVGWSWIYFRDYDFEKNPLGFSERILPILRQNGAMMSEIEHADCVGIDFHKVGFAPYVSSVFLYKNAAEFEGLHRRGQDAYLQVRTPYNPMYYTLEVSRTAGGALAAWATLKYFGMEGFQALLGGILETKYYLYDLLAEQPDMVCVNADDTGLINLYRIYPKGVDAKVQYAKELTNPGGRADLIQNNHLTEAVGNLLVRMVPHRQEDRWPIHALDELQHRLPCHRIQPRREGLGRGGVRAEVVPDEPLRHAGHHEAYDPLRTSGAR